MKIKRLFAIAVMMLGMANTYAQSVDNTFQFVDASGNVVPDGSTVTFYAEKEEDDFGELVLQAKFGLSVKNTTNADAYVSVNFVTEQKTNGNTQVCFPVTCIFNIPVDFTTDSGLMAANEIRPLNSEWLPEEGKYGTARFTVQLLVMDRFGMSPNYFYEEVAKGPKVTVNCVYSDPNGISNLESDKNVTVVARYNGSGQAVTAPVKGVNILKLSNGKTVKQIVK